jgi:NAD-dependent deacetylase
MLLCAHEFAALAERVAQAQRLLVLTGAGMSAQSGVTTFREAQTGLWARFSPEELATPEAFAATPERVMDWYRWRRGLVAAAEPNAGHRAVARRQRTHAGTAVVTQNVDGLHQRAGSPDVVELHGRLSHLRCECCGQAVPWPADDPGGVLVHECGTRAVAASGEGFAAGAAPTGRLRPDIVWFGEALPPAAWDRAERLARDADVVLVVGTSGLVHPAASLPVIARRAGAFVVEVNPQATPLSPQMDACVAGTAAEVLPALLGVGGA